MAKTSLVIMAAGIGSRYGAGIKQLEKVGPSGEIIIDYSIHDAILAGFDRIVFIIRKEIEQDFREVIGDRISLIAELKGVEICYAFQELEDLPEGFTVPEGRKKPWGTGQAILAVRDIVREPFAIINADDYYGKHVFSMLHEFLVNCDPEKPDYCMAGYILRNTLSDNGTVTRGLCKEDGQGYLAEIRETYHIEKTESGAKNEDGDIPVDSICSMNMWGLTPGFLGFLKEGFPRFLKDMKNPEKDEYLIPTIIGEMVDRGEASVRILKTDDTWFGITYHEDKAKVQEAFAGLISRGEYNDPLFSDF